MRNKSINIICTICLLLFGMVLIVGCKSTPQDVYLNDISIANADRIQTTYFTYDESFKLNGAEITLNYNDGSTKNVDLELSMISAFDNTEGTHVATITYEGKTTSFIYTVKAVIVEKIELTSSPKTSYYTSSKNYELSSSRIMVRYNDGSTRNIDLELSMISAFDNTAGAHTATITYEGKTTSFIYTVEAVKVENIELTSSPKTNYYTSSKNYELSSAQLKISYNDSSIRNVNLELSMISAFDNKVGTHTATITFEGKTTTFSYTIEEVKAVTINSVEGVVTDYLVGDSLTLNNPKIYFTNNDGTNGDVVINANNITGFSSSDAGQYTMTISYQLAEYDLPYNIYHKDYVSSSFVNIASETSADMPMMFIITKSDIQGNKFTIKYKENDTSSLYQTLIEDSDLKTFEINGVSYNLELGSEISLTDGTNKYVFSPIVEAKKVIINLGENLKTYYVSIKNASLKITNINFEMFAGEKITIYPECDNGYVVTEIRYGENKYNFNDASKKYVDFYVHEDTPVVATIAEATNAIITFQLKTIDFYGEDYDYGLGQQYEFKGQYSSNSFYVNNSAITQGTIRKEGDCCFTDEYKDGCAEAVDVSTGEKSYIESSFTWAIGTSITSNTELYWFVSFSGEVKYPLSSKTISGAYSAKSSVTINKDDSSTYLQQVVLENLNSRFKVILEIIVEIV